jgi:UDP-3-O-[3-hydroxymyristoyl] glucosamine N-acyltransferase
MEFNNEILVKAINVEVSVPIKCENLGLNYHTQSRTLSFLDDAKFLDSIIANDSIVALFVTSDLVDEFNKTKIVTIVCDSPRLKFYDLHNYLVAQIGYLSTKINNTAVVNDHAYVAPTGVIIDENVEIGPNAAILEGAHLKKGCIVKAGAVIGSTGFDYNSIEKGNHDNKSIKF